MNLNDLDLTSLVNSIGEIKIDELGTFLVQDFTVGDSIKFHEKFPEYNPKDARDALVFFAVLILKNNKKENITYEELNLITEEDLIKLYTKYIENNSLFSFSKSDTDYINAEHSQSDLRHSDQLARLYYIVHKGTMIEGIHFHKN